MTTTDNPRPESEPLAPEAPTFDTLPLRPEVRRAIDEIGWVNPTPVQLQTYRLAVEGRDLLVQSRTGTGKTGAFGIPMVDRIVSSDRGVQALVLAPTRELALQSANEIGKIGRHRGLRTSAVYGGAPMDKQIRELEEGAQIVSGTPGRVLDHLRRGTLDPSGLRLLVLDEADEMLSMGFARELHAILELLPRERQTMLFSATVDGPVQRMTERHMRNPEFIALSGDAVGALGVTHYVYFVSGVGRTSDLIRVIEVEDPESAIIFCNTKAETEQVAQVLKQAGFNADWLNGDLPQNEREKIMGRTRRSEIRFLVATDVAARGIDISHLTHVINFSLPSHLEQYVHRTGRTGRAGRTGTAITLVSPQDLGQLYYLRLQYRIVPVERSLPAKGEERTRLETDRVSMLEAAFRFAPSEMDLAVARRLLTHPEAERLVAGLLAGFFGGVPGDVDEAASAGRRSRRPRPVETDEDRKAEAREEKPKKKEKRAKEERDDASDDDGVKVATLYVNVGKRDDARTDDFARWLVDEVGVSPSLLRRVRVKDKHAFVEVADEDADGVLAKLAVAHWNDREVVAERARGK